LATEFAPSGESNESLPERSLALKDADRHEEAGDSTVADDGGIAWGGAYDEGELPWLCLLEVLARASVLVTILQRLGDRLCGRPVTSFVANDPLWLAGLGVCPRSAASK
jgi:hypothetical protein